MYMYNHPRWGVAGLKPEASAALFSHGVVAETYWQNLRFSNSSSAMMVVWFDVEIKGPRFSDTGPCEQRNL